MKTSDTTGSADFSAVKLAKLLSEASGKAISSQKISKIALAGNLFGPKKRINLLRYVAFLLSEHAKNDE